MLSWLGSIKWDIVLLLTIEQYILPKHIPTSLTPFTRLCSGELSSMRHLKEEVDGIARGKECGLRFTDQDLRFEAGDTLICYRVKQVQQTTDWDPGF